MKIESINRVIEIVEYSETYPIKYTNEEVRIKSVLNNIIDSIHHVGSTSVPTLKGKPTIDILICLKSQFHINDAINEFTAIGYNHIEELLTYRPNRRIFWRGTPKKHEFHIHVVEADSIDAVEMLRFREELLHNMDARETYAELKTKLANKWKTNIGEYVMGKDKFYTSLITK